MTEVRLVGIEKRYSKNAPQAVAGVDLTIASEEFFVLLGPSGCGKSTMLKCLAGLLEPTQGRVLIDGQDVRGPSRDRGMVFQA